jgi:hypothetical protein
MEGKAHGLMELPARQLPGGTKESHERGRPHSQPRFEPSTSLNAPIFSPISSYKNA